MKGLKNLLKFLPFLLCVRVNKLTWLLLVMVTASATFNPVKAQERFRTADSTITITGSQTSNTPSATFSITTNKFVYGDSLSTTIIQIGLSGSWVDTSYVEVDTFKVRVAGGQTYNMFLPGAAPGAGGGETNTASNLITSGGLILFQKTGVDFELRGIQSGNNITVSQNDSAIVIASDSSFNILKVVGGSALTQNDTIFVSAGTNITLTTSNDTLSISVTNESIEDVAGAMVSGNTETRIAVTYDDGAGKLNFVVDDSVRASNISDTTKAIAESGITFETNDGTRHDHKEVDVDNLTHTAKDSTYTSAQIDTLNEFNNDTTIVNNEIKFDSLAVFAAHSTGDFIADEYDFRAGDNDSASVIRIGNLEFGTSKDATYGASLVVGGSMFLNLINAPDGMGEFFITESGGAIRLAVPSSGAGWATNFIRSGMFAGPSVLKDSTMMGIYWGFNRIRMDTGNFGADVGIQNNVQVGDSIYVNTNITVGGEQFTSRSDSTIIDFDGITTTGGVTAEGAMSGSNLSGTNTGDGDSTWIKATITDTLFLTNGMVVAIADTLYWYNAIGGALLYKEVIEGGSNGQIKKLTGNILDWASDATGGGGSATADSASHDWGNTDFDDLRPSSAAELLVDTLGVFTANADFYILTRGVGDILLQDSTTVTGDLTATGDVTGNNLSGTNTGDEALSTSSAGLDVSDHAVDLDVTPSAGSPTLEEAEDALQVKYGGTLTESGNGLDADTTLIATQNDLHVAVTLAGQNYATLSTQEITFGKIDSSDINWGTGSDQVSAEAIPLLRVSGSTDSTVQQMQDTFHSTGTVTGGAVTDAGSNTIDIASGRGYIRATDSPIATLLFFDWSDSLGHAVPADTVIHVGIEYNGGSPRMVVKSSRSWDNNTEFELASVVREDTIHIENNPHIVGDHAGLMIKRLKETAPKARNNLDGGLIIGETGTRNVTVSAGTVWDRLNIFSITSFNSSVAGDSFDTYVGETIEGVNQVQWDNDNYNNAGVLTSLSANRYANLWWYGELDDDVLMIYGTAQYTSIGAAEGEGKPTTLPKRILAHGKFLGRFIFQKGASTTEKIESDFDQFIPGSGVTDHANLANLDLASANHTGELSVTNGGTAANLSATGGANQFVKQSSSGAAFTVETIGNADVPDDITIDLATTVTTNANLTGEVTSTGNAAVIVESFLEDGGASEIAVTAGMMNTGTGASASTFWRGDNTWVTPSGSGDMLKADFPDSLLANYKWHTADGSPAAGDTLLMMKVGVLYAIDIGDMPSSGMAAADFGDSLVNYDGDGIKITDLDAIDVLVDFDGALEIVDDSLNVKAISITNAMLAGSIDLTAKVTGILPVANGGTNVADLDDIVAGAKAIVSITDGANAIIAGNVTVELVTSTLKDTLEAIMNHDNLVGFVANEHTDHTSVTLTAGDGLSGGGTIAANRTFTVNVHPDSAVGLSGDSLAVRVDDTTINIASNAIKVKDGGIGTTQIGTDGVSADELNATGVESELEAVLDLPELQGTLGNSKIDEIKSAWVDSGATDGLVTHTQYDAVKDFFSFAVDSANGLTSDTLWVWQNGFGATVTIDSIHVGASADNYAITFFEKDYAGGNIQTVDVVTASTDGANWFYITETSISHAAIEAGDWIGFLKPTGTGKNVAVRIHYGYTRP